MSEWQKSPFAMHLFRASGYVAAFFWLAFVWGALKVLSMPDTRRHAHLAGWTILIAATAVAIGTIDRWVRYLAVIFGGGVLGGLIATGTGHLLNETKPFPRLVAACITVLLVGCSLLSRGLAQRTLTMFDRGMLLASLFAFVTGIVMDTLTAGLIGLSVGFACLLITRMRDRLSSSPNW